MSAPDTNIKRQEKEHRGPLFGMGFALLWSTVLLIGLVVWVVYAGNEPGDGVAVDGSPAPTEQSVPSDTDPAMNERAAPATADEAPAAGTPATQPPATTTE